MTKSKVKGVRVPAGKYITLADYARRENLTWVGAKGRIYNGKVKAIFVGPHAWLVKVR